MDGDYVCERPICGWCCFLLFSAWRERDSGWAVVGHWIWEGVTGQIVPSDGPAGGESAKGGPDVGQGGHHVLSMRRRWQVARRDGGVGQGSCWWNSGGSLVKGMENKLVAWT